MYKDILLTVDLEDSESWQSAVPTAVEYAQAFGARLHIMHVVPDFGMSIVGSFFPTDFENKAITHANKALHAFVGKHIPTGIPVQHIVAHGSIYREIIRVADEIKADLIVMAAHRSDFGEYILGPNAARVVRHARQSVLVVRQ